MNDTIVGISTALSNSAISIVRISGDNAIDIASKIFKGKNLHNLRTNTINYGHIIDEGCIVDEVLISIFKSPKTFTKEDIVEINCHGGVYVTNKILQIILDKGARLAEPGEFTKRAFLNGRIDLTQAESVMDVINAESEQTLRVANKGLRGDIKRLVELLRDELLVCISKIEVNIDYPEYEDEEIITKEILLPKITILIDKLEKLLEKSKQTIMIKEGINTAIIGKPNVGKSSILNCLLGEEKAIVTNIEGTTRDTVEGKVRLGALTLNLIDTAGIRKTEDLVEKIGVNKSFKLIEQAELLILVFDYSRELDDNDLKILKLTENKKRLIIVNKSDLEKRIDLEFFKDYILISTYDNNSLHIIEDKVNEITAYSTFKDNETISLNNARQIDKLSKALQSLKDAKKGLISSNPIDIVNIDISAAWRSLGEIIGKVSSDDLINELFSKFCLGK